MTNQKNDIEKYMQLTGQSMQDIYAGSSQVGMDYINNVLIPKAISEKKKIVWRDTNLETGEGEYSLEDID